MAETDADFSTNRNSTNATFKLCVVYIRKLQEKFVKKPAMRLYRKLTDSVSERAKYREAFQVSANKHLGTLTVTDLVSRRFLAP